MKDLTVEELARLCEQEMTSAGLGKLPDGFAQDVCKLLENLRSEVERKGGLERKLAERQLTEATRLVRRLCSLRAVKILVFLMSGKVAENLLESEKSFLSQVEALLNKAVEELVSEERIAIRIPSVCARRLVVFRIAVQQKIVGVDGRMYGPFTPGEVANLPEENAEILVKHGFAEEIHTR